MLHYIAIPKTILCIFLAALLLAMSNPINAQTAPPIEPGVSKILAEWRAKHYSDIRYRLNITLEKMSPLMKGEIEIKVTLDEEATKSPLILDWRTTQFKNDKDQPYANVVGVNDALDIKSQFNNEHILIPNGLLKVGENVVKIQFASPIKTSGSAITRYIDKEDGSEYIYSLFVPSDASTAFPIFDQPDLKARFSLTVFPPKEHKVVSNEEIEFAIEPPQHIRNRLIGYEFRETKPISPYVFAFAVGEFDVFNESDLSENLTSFSELRKRRKTIQTVYEALNVKIINEGSQIYVRKSQAEKFKPHAAEVFRLNRECVKYLEEYFDYKFPFPKYDLVLIPEFPFGGMEHAGATFLREASIIFPSEPTKSDLTNRANLIFHETAHQWFGDTVTMKWFDDLWLKEGFATFMGYKAMEKIMPEINAWKVFYERIKQGAYQTDSTKGTVPIYQDIPNLSAAKSAYGNIVYNKAPAFLRQAEFYLGEKEFQTAVRSFLKKHEFKNATWLDLVGEFSVAFSLSPKRVLSKGLSKDALIQENKNNRELVTEWANIWVKEKGVSIIRVTVSEGEITRNKVQGFGVRYDFLENTNADLTTYQNSLKHLQQVKLLYEYDNQKFFERDSVSNATSYFYSREFIEKLVPPAKIPIPKFIFPNYQDYGYGIFLLDEKSRKYILANVQNEKDDFLRSMMYGSLWDSVREAEMDPKEYVELVIKNVAAEKDEMIVASMLGRAGTALNYYMSEPPASAGSNDLVRKLEEILISKMQTAETAGQRITFYRSFLNIASSEKAKSLLKEFLNPAGTIKSPFPFKTKDKFDVVSKLFSLGDKDAPQLLADLQKTETSDDAKRYAYAAQAGIPTAGNKARYWNDFVNNKEISESWIEAAFGSFNSVKHSQHTLPYLEKALAELPNHKRDRKIFFVNGWLGAFIGGQKSEEALVIVNKFLAANPGLDKDLRLKILENLDVIERAVKIRKKFQKG